MFDSIQRCCCYSRICFYAIDMNDNAFLKLARNRGDGVPAESRRRVVCAAQPSFVCAAQPSFVRAAEPSFVRLHGSI